MIGLLLATWAGLQPGILAATDAGLKPGLRAVAHFDKIESKKLVPMLQEVVRFPTIAGNDDAFADQKKWLMKTASDLGLVARDAGLVTEIELPPSKPTKNPPILGLVVHGDVQPVDADAWSDPPFSAVVKESVIYGRGTADDKGPLVQALLAMHALKESGAPRTHLIRLIVGSDEESSNKDIASYLATHKPPDYSLVLDSAFPVVAGEKAWQALAVSTPLKREGVTSNKPYEVSDIMAGLAASIVPDHAEVTLVWKEGQPDWQPLANDLKAYKMPEGTRLVTGSLDKPRQLKVVAYGVSAHAGVNIEGGRNAIVGLARALEGKLPPGGADDLLAFVRAAGRDIYGTGLGITDNDPLWGHYAVNIATIKPTESGDRELTINIRRTPPRSGAQLKAMMESFVADFDKTTGASLKVTDHSFWDDEPLSFDPRSKIVQRLLADYAAATGEKNPKPAISGGGTYAKRLPNSIAFGMWFPDKPYPGHDVNEQVPIDDLMKGTRVLIRALADIAGGPKMENAFAAPASGRLTPAAAGSFAPVALNWRR